MLPIILGALLSSATPTAAAPTANGAAAAAPTRASVLSAQQVVQILDETLEWYRMLGAQQQTASEPSDMLILYANRQTADKVIGLAFDIARANAELLSSEADATASRGKAAASPETVAELQQRADQRRASILAEIDANRRALAAASATSRPELSAKASELQGELDMVNAQKNLLDTIADFATENDAKRAGVSALKAHIDAIAMSIPAASPRLESVRAQPAAGAASEAPVLTRTSAAAGTGALSGIGIWDLLAEAVRLSGKIRTIATVDRSTAALQVTFQRIRAAPLAQLEELSTRSDALATLADTANGATLRNVRDQFDTLAWLFTQTSAILLPLTKEDVLLGQYRQNLRNWHDSGVRQYHEVLGTLVLRVLILLTLLAAVLAGAEFWRRTVLKYEHEPRRRYQLLLIRKLVLWTLLILILGLAFINKLSSFATFAGLLTAGVAVAMQSVLVSVVGYFFLIGKYGVRVGDRVQVGAVVGEVIDLGLVRMHLLELNPQGTLGPTGRVVAFANSIVFQSSGGLFRQLPGVNFAWHEATFSLPAGSDYIALKDQLLAALTAVVGEYHAEIVRQTKEIQRTMASRSFGEVSPQVQLQYSVAGVEAKVRYPVHAGRAADIDERVAQELLAVIAKHPRGGDAQVVPAAPRT